MFRVATLGEHRILSDQMRLSVARLRDRVVNSGVSFKLAPTDPTHRACRPPRVCMCLSPLYGLAKSDIPIDHMTAYDDHGYYNISLCPQVCRCVHLIAWDPHVVVSSMFHHTCSRALRRPCRQVCHCTFAAIIEKHAFSSPRSHASVLLHVRKLCKRRHICKFVDALARCCFAHVCKLWVQVVSSDWPGVGRMWSSMVDAAIGGASSESDDGDCAPPPQGGDWASLVEQMGDSSSAEGSAVAERDQAEPPKDQPTSVLASGQRSGWARMCADVLGDSADEFEEESITPAERGPIVNACHVLSEDAVVARPQPEAPQQRWTLA